MLETARSARAVRRRRLKTGECPTISPVLRRWFAWYASRYVARHFSAVRIAGGEPPMLAAGRPAVVFLNHPSWWDPLIAAVLAMTFYPERSHYAPI